ncbi:MAG: cupin domain-containing protein [Sumerlaeia bacterium]
MSEQTATLFHVESTLTEGAPAPSSILSQSLVQNPVVKAVRFVFAKGQELSEHTASVPALLHQVSGTSRWGLGEETTEAKPGDWAYLPANLKHSLVASEDCVILLLLLKRGE